MIICLNSYVSLLFCFVKIYFIHLCQSTTQHAFCPSKVLKFVVQFLANKVFTQFNRKVCQCQMRYSQKVYMAWQWIETVNVDMIFCASCQNANRSSYTSSRWFSHFRTITIHQDANLQKCKMSKTFFMATPLIE